MPGSYQYIDYSLQGDVAVLVLNQPDMLNAISEAMAGEIIAALDHAARSARAVLLTGAGRAFCAGAALAPEMVNVPLDQYDAGLPLERSLNPVIHKLRDAKLPVVAAVNGAAAGIGVSIALACDMVIAADNAYLLLAFKQIGLVPDGGASHAIVRAIGRLRATELMMLGERLPAARAQEWGLVNRVVPAAELRDAAMTLATQLAAGPTLALARMKQLAWTATDVEFAEMITLERRLQYEAGQTADHREGIAAFFEKRPPRFTGR